MPPGFLVFNTSLTMYTPQTMQFTVYPMSRVVKKDGVTIKMKKADLDSAGPDEEIARFLTKHADDAYTIRGIMHELYEVATADMQDKWSVWPHGLPSLYSRVNRALERLRKAGKITKTRKGRADFWAWKAS